MSTILMLNVLLLLSIIVAFILATRHWRRGINERDSILEGYKRIVQKYQSRCRAYTDGEWLQCNVKYRVGFLADSTPIVRLCFPMQHSIIVKKFIDSDADYALRCAEEACDKLNEQI